MLEQLKRYIPKLSWGEGAKAATPIDQVSGSFGWDTLFGCPTIFNKIGSSFFHLTAIELEGAFGSHPIVRACSGQIADTSVTARLEVGQWRLNEWMPVKGHPVLDLLEMPNATTSSCEFQSAVINRNALTGFGYVVKVRNGVGVPVELHTFPTSWMTEQRNGRGQLVSYKITGNAEPFPLDDVFAFKSFDPSSVQGATSMLESAAHEFKLDIERTMYQGDMMTNLDTPGLIVHTERKITDPAQRAKYEDKFSQKYKRGQGRGGPIFTHGEGSVEAFNPLKDLDFPGLEAQAETRICTAFGVSPLIISARAGLDRSTYANYEQAWKSFMLNRMRTTWDILAATYTRGLLRNEGEQNLKFRFRYDELPEFQEDATAKSTRAVSEWNAGLVKKNEAREMIGQEKDPDPSGDEYKTAALPSFSFSPGERQREAAADEKETEDDEE